MPIQVFLRGGRTPNRHTEALPGWAMGSPSGTTRSIPKPTPWNLRRFAESPIPRQAINSIKDPIAALSWELRPIKDVPALPGQAARIKAGSYCLNHPNSDDSWRSFCEQIFEDILGIAAGSIELARSPNPERPLWMWPVDGSSIQLYPGWTENPREARYAQITGYSGMEIPLRNDELIYIKCNPRTHTPFGLAPLEVAFSTINNLLGAQNFAAKTASNQGPQGILDLGEGVTADQVSAYRAYWRNEVEGRGIVPIIGGQKAPQFIRLFKGDDSDMRMAWQEFLIRTIASAFNLSPMALGNERDVNRSTADVMGERDWDKAIKPMANLLSEHITREALHRKLGWTDLEHVWTDLDQEDDERLGRIMGGYLDRGVYTPDEVREKMGLAPLPGGWGKLVRTQNAILIAQAAGTKADIQNPAVLDLLKEFAPPEPTAGGGKMPRMSIDDSINEAAPDGEED
jgi:phage portal protein BeeE